MDYERLKKLVNNLLATGKTLPAIGENENNEMVLLYQGEDENGAFYMTMTAQSNNWIRINTYYEDGTVNETYHK